MKKKLFDLIALQESPDSRFHGGAEYAKNIFFQLSQYKNESLFFYDKNLVLPKDILEECRIKGYELIGINRKQEISKLMSRVDVDGFYSAMPYKYFDVDFHDKRVLITIHGLRDIECPSDKYEYIYRNSLFSKIKLYIKKALYSDSKIISRAVMNFDRIINIENLTVITVSHHSKYSLLSNFPGLDSSDIKVIYSPHKFMEKSRCEARKDNVFLLISGNRWVKNNYRAICALDQLFTDGRLSKYKVKVVGWKGEAILNRLSNPDRFMFLDYVEEEKLNELFIKSKYFIYPTLNEGYGYPPLKAFESGTVVIASSHTSVVEVCEDAALYFNPYSIMEIKTRILNVVYDNAFKNSLIDKGYKRASALKENSLLANEVVDEIFK